MKYLTSIHIKTIFFYFLTLAMLMPNTAFSKVSSKFIAKILKVDKNIIRKLAKNTPKKNIPNKSILSKADIQRQLPSINIKNISPEAMRVARLGKIISNKTPFSSRLINETKYPVDVIRQHMNYGDNYLVALRSSSLSLKKNLPKVSKKTFKSLHNIPAKDLKNLKSLSPDAVNDKLIMALKRTGKKGFNVIDKISRFTLKNPGKTVSAALLAWYIIDPEDMLDNIEDIGVFLGEGAGEVTAALTNGTIKGAASSNPYLVLVIVSIVSIVLFRYLKRLLLLPSIIFSLFDRRKKSIRSGGDLKNKRNVRQSKNKSGIF